MFTIDAYKEDNRWFFDDLLLDIKHEEFVSGVPSLIENLCGNKFATKIHAIVDLKPFDNAVKIVYTQSEYGGVSFRYKDQQVWFCAVFWKYFKELPKAFWVKVEEV